MNQLSALCDAFENEVNVLTSQACDPDLVHALIVSRLPRPNQPLAKAAAHHFRLPGKMLRAKMAMRGAAILQVDHSAGMLWAASIEVLHNASLIHDDICDGDEKRRGRQAVWAKFGKNVALALGDWLIALSFELAAEAAEVVKTPRLVGVLAEHMATTTSGEAMEFEWNGNQSWEIYLRIAANKTAPLLTAPIQGIAVMAADCEAEVNVAHYFRDLGKAYQIANDILNFEGSDGAVLIAGDLARRSPSAVTLSFMGALCADEQVAFENWYNSNDNCQLEIWQNKVLNSRAIEIASRLMLTLLSDAELKANTFPLKLFEVVTPVHALIKRVCASSVHVSD